MWTYRQDTGELERAGEVVARGYSGHGEGRNNPAMQSIHDVGPIPAGDWNIRAPRDTDTHGPYVLPLEPCAGTETFGRAGFLIHGFAADNPEGASLGCVIFPRGVREKMWRSGDHLLRVVPPMVVTDPELGL